MAGLVIGAAGQQKGPVRIAQQELGKCVAVDALGETPQSDQSGPWSDPAQPLLGLYPSIHLRKVRRPLAARLFHGHRVTRGAQGNLGNHFAHDVHDL